MEDKPSHVDETTVRSSGRIRPLSERARKIHRQKILVARANAAARQIEINALTEKAAYENELKELQRAMSRKKREIENERISVLLTVKRAKILVYADTRPNGDLCSTSQNQLLKIGHDCPQEFAPLDCITEEGNMPFAIRTRRIGGKGNVNHIVPAKESDIKNAIYFNEVTLPQKAGRSSHANCVIVAKKLRCIVPEKESDIKYEPQTIEKHEQVSLHFTEHFPQTVQIIASLQQETEGRKTLKEGDAYPRITRRYQWRSQGARGAMPPPKLLVNVFFRTELMLLRGLNV